MPSKNNHNKSVGSTIERSNDRIDQTGEVFTPMELVYQMVDEILDPMYTGDPEIDWRRTFLDNSCGDGNFPYALLQRLTSHRPGGWGVDPKFARDNMIYCVEYMEDNHREMCNRLGVDVTHPHYVHADATTYHYRFDGSPPVDKEPEPPSLEAFFV